MGNGAGLERSPGAGSARGVGAVVVVDNAEDALLRAEAAATLCAVLRKVTSLGLCATQRSVGVVAWKPVCKVIGGCLEGLSVAAVSPEAFARRHSLSFVPYKGRKPGRCVARSGSGLQLPRCLCEACITANDGDVAAGHLKRSASCRCRLCLTVSAQSSLP